MKKIDQIIRRFKYLIHLFIALIGVILIIVADSYFSGTGDNITYDVLIGIGCSVIATAIITLLLLAVLPDNKEENTELAAWGLKRIHDERRTATFPPDECPTNKLDYIAFGLKHFRSTTGYDSRLLRNIRRGLHVRILTLHPHSEFVQKQEKFENAVGLKSDIKELIRWVKDMNSQLGKNPRGSIEIKFYNCIPLHFYCRADSQIWVGPYLPGTASNNAITYEFYIDSKGGKLYEDTFQDYWEGKRNVHIVCEDNEPLLGNQKLSIESVMRYFCEEMKKDDGTDIIGVVVIFKEKQNLRRTLFSCNKPYEERYNCYGLQEGAVGKLIELNKSEKRVVFFRDYTNDLSITLDIQGRDRHVRKIDLSIERFKKETDMSAILAAPIYCNHKMVGAVTFDFNRLSSKYQKSIAELKALSFGSEVSGDGILCSWLHMAESCARMITYMLGDEIETQYKDLYEEEWKPNDQI